VAPSWVEKRGKSTQRPRNSGWEGGGAAKKKDNSGLFLGAGSEQRLRHEVIKRGKFTGHRRGINARGNRGGINSGISAGGALNL